jgi:hypothetical protein
MSMPFKTVPVWNARSAPGRLPDDGYSSIR